MGKLKKQPGEVPPPLTRAVIKTVAGIAVTKPGDFLRLAAHSGDLMIKRHFSQALHDTYTYFMRNGEIKPEYFDSTSFGDLAPEFGKISDSSFGIFKLNQLRKMFVNLAKDNGSSSHEKYLLDIALELSELELKVLIGDFNSIGTMSTNPPDREITSASEWARVVAETSGLKHENLVRVASETLIARGLMTPYQYGDKSGVACSPTASRLTSSGLELCEMLLLEDDPVDENG